VNFNTPYIHDEVVHNEKAARTIMPFVLQIIKPGSVLDVGCGTGTWLKVVKDLGVDDILGIDGDFVDRNLLKVDPTNFLAKDLSKSFDLGRKFDLAICLEVAEHLPEESADSFVKSLAIHSDTIFFSAAIPGQGGQNHLNEQWPVYWETKFRSFGFTGYDVLRKEFWNNPTIEWWYRQNIVLFTKSATIVKLFPENQTGLTDFVHPELLIKKNQEILDLKTQAETNFSRPGLKYSFNQFVKAIKRKVGF
jgi:SAM-dependent methyltransferase